MTKRRMFTVGALRGGTIAPHRGASSRRVGSGIKMGEAHFYGAREGAKPPPLKILFDFIF